MNTAIGIQLEPFQNPSRSFMTGDIWGEADDALEAWIAAGLPRFEIGCRVQYSISYNDGYVMHGEITIWHDEEHPSLSNKIRRQLAGLAGWDEQIGLPLTGIDSYLEELQRGRAHLETVLSEYQVGPGRHESIADAAAGITTSMRTGEQLADLRIREHEAWVTKRDRILATIESSRAEIRRRLKAANDVCKAISGDDEEDARRAVVSYYSEFSPPHSYTLDRWFEEPALPLSTDDLEVRSQLQAAERLMTDWRLVMSADSSSDASQADGWLQESLRSWNSMQEDSD